MEFTEKFIDFNKELFFGEIGGIIGAPLFGFLSSFIFSQSNIISAFTVLGSATGATFSWLFMRIKHEKSRGTYSLEKLTKDVSFYTPAAFLIALIFAYPTIFSVTNEMLETFMQHPLIAGAIGELSGFCVFLILINIYRTFLNKKFGREL